MKAKWSAQLQENETFFELNKVLHLCVSKRFDSAEFMASIFDFNF